MTARALDRLTELVLIETPSGHTRGLLALYEQLREWADPLFGRAGEVITVSGVPHLLWRARTQPSVLLLGHADTVWPLGTLDGWPLEVTGCKATGPGVFDMKAGLIIAIEALALAGNLDHVSLLVTGDEEIGSGTSRALLERSAHNCSAVLVLEPNLDGALKTARKGASMYRLAIEGRAAHAGLEPEAGVNSLLELAFQALAIAELGDADRGTTVTPTVGVAGTVTNAVPASAELHVDVRAWELVELQRVHTALNALTPSVPGATLTMHGAINRPPMDPAVSGDLLATLRRVAERAGLGPIATVSVGGGSDGNFTSALGIPTLDGLGALGDGAHARHEWVDVTSISKRATLVAALLRELAPMVGPPYL